MSTDAFTSISDGAAINRQPTFNEGLSLASVSDARSLPSFHSSSAESTVNSLFGTPQIIQPDGQPVHNGGSDSSAASPVPSGPDSNKLLCAADDGPRSHTESRLDGDVQVSDPAELGNAHRIVELIGNGQLTDGQGNLTPAAQQAISAAIENTGFLQTYEGRAAEVQRYLNNHVFPPVTLSFNRGANVTSNTATGDPRPSTITFNGQTFRAGFGPGR